MFYIRTPDNKWNGLKERQEWVYISSASLTFRYDEKKDCEWLIAITKHQTPKCRLVRSAECVEHKYKKCLFEFIQYLVGTPNRCQNTDKPGYQTPDGQAKDNITEKHEEQDKDRK